MANDLEKKIIKQIEYYFGDFNLPKDKFLQQKVTEDEGWINLDVLLTFKRLAALTTDADVIVDALKKSENGLVEVNGELKKVRRVVSKPLPQLTDERRKEIMERTAYAKEFPLDETQEEIEKFAEEIGPIESCSMRMYLDKAIKEHKFKGSCFIVFKNLEDCKKFVEAESFQYKEVELVRKYQNKYFEDKKKEYDDRKHERKNKKKKQEEAVEEATNKKIQFPKGAILHFKFIDQEQTLTREEIKSKLTDVNDTEPSYIDYSKNDKEGYIRMPNENDAVEVFKKITDGILEVGDVKLQFRVADGEEEEEYHNKTRDIMSRTRKKQKRGGRGKGGYRQNNKRKGGSDEEEPASKKGKKNNV